MTSTKSKPFVAKIPLIDTLEQEYQDWLEIKQSLGIKRSLKSFLYFIHNYGEAFIADEGVKRFQKRVTFNNGTKSYSTVTMLTARNEWETRLANGAEVTGYNMDQSLEWCYWMGCIR